ncbi:hypothetical protein [Sphaerisporangium sp. TRM90804]|uniref:hypothetical protein n=1 Tax=Sphaerisporangium sp. TRM90804 TaxID=3031113 RepID=UPI00244827CD|nr:hypothetical protein [Sphaerisporangium sp. TRM90804]MDH2428456.1 hypothetical protein [Sphaerisporangium sp. TRM90804]
MVGEDRDGVVVPPGEFGQGLVSLLLGLDELVGEFGDDSGVGVDEFLESSLVLADFGRFFSIWVARSRAVWTGADTWPKVLNSAYTSTTQMSRQPAEAPSPS